jgi:penicillin-insensitive murein endopeptidase
MLAAAILAIIALDATLLGTGAAQDRGTLDPKPLPPLEHPDAPGTPARQLFGRAAVPSKGAAHAVGFYSNGCIAGAAQLPINGSKWQVMRLSRNRNYGHPELIQFLETLAANVHQSGDWNGLLVGDMSQPRGGPMMGGHASHQVGLDADIWLTPMPDRDLTLQEREEMSATMVVASDRKDVDPAVWTPGHMRVIKTAARDPRVERIFVNAAIKKALCRDTDPDRAWMSKVRAYWGHDYHFHVRLRCPADSPNCRPQTPPPTGDGCGKDLDWWFTDAVLHPKPEPKPSTEPSRPQLTLAGMPSACRGVLAAPAVDAPGVALPATASPAAAAAVAPPEALDAK